MPVVVALVGVSQSDMRWWPFFLPLAILAPLALGAIPWLTTHYRLTEAQIQVRSGLLNKTTSTAPLDRVRSVDLEASLLHRVLGLQKVQIGTGVDDDRITLDALAAADAQALRTTLLRRRELPAGDDRSTGPSDPAERGRPGSRRAPGPPVGAHAPGPDRLVVVALRTLQPQPAGDRRRRARRLLAVRRQPADLERGDRDVGLALGHPVRGRRRRRRPLDRRPRVVGRRRGRRLRRAVVELPARARARLAAPDPRPVHHPLDHRRGGQGPRRPADRARAHAHRRRGRARRRSPRASRTG